MAGHDPGQHPDGGGERARQNAGEAGCAKETPGRLQIHSSRCRGLAIDTSHVLKSALTLRDSSESPASSTETGVEKASRDAFTKIIRSDVS
jgi:hypothetical protein